MANPDPEQCGSKDSVLLQSVEENKGDDSKSGNIAAESISHVTEKVKTKRRRSSRRKARVSSAMASKPTVPEIHSEADLEPPKLHVPMVAATPMTYLTSNFIYCKGNYFKAGDVVSVTDEEFGPYYAQIKKFITYEDFKKCAIVTWLFPTRASPPPDMSFDPSTYTIGPEENLPRKLENMCLVMRLPSDYYTKRKNPTTPTDAKQTVALLESKF